MIIISGVVEYCFRPWLLSELENKSYIISFISDQVWSVEAIYILATEIPW